MIAFEKDGEWCLRDSWNRKSETYKAREKIKALGGRWDASRKHWIVSERAVEELGAERCNDPFYPHLHQLHQVVRRLGMHSGLALRIEYFVEFEYKCYESWGHRVKIELLPFTPMNEVAESFRAIVQSGGKVQDSPQQWVADNALPAFKAEGPIAEFDALCEKALDFVAAWRERQGELM